MRFAALCLIVLCAAGCGSEKSGLEGLETQPVTLPDGKTIRAEVMIKQFDVQRGMMFRASLAPDHGMLFIHSKPGAYSYWMYIVNIPLDIIWMDRDRRIVEIAANAAPCHTKASECPTYGGHQVAQFVLELAGGQAAAHHLQTGETITF